jgi:hypothetical protein
MARLLNAGVLPAGYYAVPFLDHEGPVEIDVAALRERRIDAGAINPGAAPHWSPAAPMSSVAVDWTDLDDVRVEIFSDEGDPHLAAAIELVSPGNKDRFRAREAFASKCAEHLRRGRGLVVIDAVTTRAADLRRDLRAALGAESGATADGVNLLIAISYRAVADEHGAGQLLDWPAEMRIGQPLPTLPLWLGADLAVPLDLEASHTAACQDLRITSSPNLQ